MPRIIGSTYSTKIKLLCLSFGKHLTLFILFSLAGIPYIYLLEKIDHQSFSLLFISTVFYWMIISPQLIKFSAPIELTLTKLLSYDCYNYKNILLHSKRLLMTCDTTDKLSSILKHIFQDELKFEKVSLFMQSSYQNDTPSFYNVEPDPSQTLSKMNLDHPLPQILSSKKKIITNLKHDIFSKRLDSFSASSCIPLFKNTQLLGFILVWKQEPLFPQDIHLFNIIAKEVNLTLDQLKPYEEIEESLKRTLELAEKVENDVSYARLTRGIAHEIRNPLGILLSAFELVVDLRDDIEESNKIMEIAKSTILRLTKITSTMLKYGNPVSSQKEQTSINTLLSELAIVCQGEIKKRHINLQLSLADIPLISLDSVSISQALLNIVLNSIQSIETHGDILIQTSLDSFLDPYKNKHIRAIKMTIHDTGKGISEDHLDQIFDPFFSTKHKSAGLGLSIVRKIIYEHQGSIKISSEENKYALVTIYLPLNTDSATQT